jgi:phenylacetate-CoA ligase
VIFPLLERIKHHETVSVRCWLEETQWWERDRLQALQLTRLQALLHHASECVPYYRECFARVGFDPADCRSISDLARLPILGKPEIRANLDALKATGAKGLARFNTGGSSGEPLIFFIGRERVSHDVAAKWRATRWWGVDIGDPEVVVWGSPIELSAQDRARAWRDCLMRTELLPAFEMSDSRLDDFLDRIRRRRPKMLFGYPSAISRIARHAEERGRHMDDLGVKVVFCTSERLYDEQRQIIERVFCCRVANGYGGRDAGFIAHECPHGGMHLTAEDIIVEIVGGDGQVLPPGQAGEIVITHLATGDFPFIRYRTGDVAVLGEGVCSCGRGLPLLQEIQGRATDFVIARDGTVMHGLALIYVVRDLAGVAAFKIIQESLDQLRVLVVAGPGFCDSTAVQIRNGVKARLGQDVEVAVETVETIPADRSGKFRYVVSKVAA